MELFWNNWEGMTRIFVLGLCAYVGLVILLRLTGNRTLSKMNSFDLVITVALGSTLSSGLLQKSLPLAEVLFAFFMLIGVQFLVTWFSVRSKRFESIIKTEPSILFINGQFRQETMRRVRVTEEEILAACRGQGLNDLTELEVAVLESNGQISCVQKGQSQLSQVKKTYANLHPQARQDPT